MFTDSAPRGTHRAETVRFIDQQHRLVTLFDIDKRGQLRKISVHAVDTFDTYQNSPILTSDVGQNTIKRRKIIVWERPS